MSEYQEKRYARITRELKKSETESWSGVHKGLQYEIKHFPTYEGRTGWTYYVYIDLEQVSDEFHKDLWLEPMLHRYLKGGTPHINYDYNKSRCSDIDWHGGITWYSKESGLEHDEQRKRVKFGCDFQHSFDEGIDYSIYCVKGECLETIDQLVNMFGEVKYYTQGDGKYRLESELT